MVLTIIKRYICQFFYQIILLSLTLLLIISLPVLTLAYLPYLFYRFLITIYAWAFRPDLLTMVSPRSSLLAQDNSRYRPKSNYIMWILLKGDLSLEKFKKELEIRVLNYYKEIPRKSSSSSKSQQNNGESGDNKNNFERRMCYPELRQYFKKCKGFIFWALDQHFSIDNHVKHSKDYGLIDEATCEENVLKLCERLLSKSWPEKQSPWQFIFVPNVCESDSSSSNETNNTYSTIEGNNNSKKTLLIFHFHAALGDPYTFLKLILHRLGTNNEFPEPLPVPPPSQLPSSPNYQHHNNQHVQQVNITQQNDKVQQQQKLSFWGFDSFSQIMHTLLLPVQLPYAYCDQFLSGFDLNEWQLENGTYTRLFRVAKIKRIPLESLLTIKNVHRISLSSVILASLAGGIRKQLRESGMSTPNKMQVYIPLPYDEHPNDKLTNHMSGCLLKLPLEVGSPRERLLYCHRTLESIRHSTIPLVNFWIPKLVGLLPWAFKDWGRNWCSTGQWLNFPGPSRPISLLGHEVDEFSINSGTIHNSTGFTMTTFNYAGYVNIDLCIDRSIAPTEMDTFNLIEKIREELNTLWEEDAI